MESLLLEDTFSVTSLTENKELIFSSLVQEKNKALSPLNSIDFEEEMFTKQISEEKSTDNNLFNGINSEEGNIIIISSCSNCTFTPRIAKMIDNLKEAQILNKINNYFMENNSFHNTFIH